jgi:hypothetical protein
MLELENEGSRIDFARLPLWLEQCIFPHLLKDSEKILGKPFAVIDNDRTNYSLCALFFA